MKLRRWVVRGVLPLLVLLATAAAPAVAEKPPLPSAANAVIHFDLERLREATLYAPVEEFIGPFARSNEQLQMFLQATDLAAATAKTKGFTIYSFSDPQHPQDFAGVLTSAFGEATRGRLEQAYAPVARNVGGRIIMPVIQTPDTEVVMSFLGPERLTFGTARAVELVVSEKDAEGMVAAYQRTATPVMCSIVALPSGVCPMRITSKIVATASAVFLCLILSGVSGCFEPPNIDKVGGVIFVYELAPTADGPPAELDVGLQRSMIDVLRTRLDPTGSRGIRISFNQAGEVEIAVPGINPDEHSRVQSLATPVGRRVRDVSWYATMPVSSNRG